MDIGEKLELEDELDSPTGCRQAVEILTRNPKKGTHTRMPISGAAAALQLNPLCSIIRCDQGRYQGRSAHVPEERIPAWRDDLGRSRVERETSSSAGAEGKLFTRNCERHANLHVAAFDPSYPRC